MFSVQILEKNCNSGANSGSPGMSFNLQSMSKYNLAHLLSRNASRKAIKWLQSEGNDLSKDSMKRLKFSAEK